MPRKLLVEYECDRCGRKWYVDYEEGKEPPEAPRLELKLHASPPADDQPAREIKFEALCQSCYQTVINLADGMDKLEKKSPKPKAKKSAPKDAQPATPPPPTDTSSEGSIAAKTPATPQSAQVRPLPKPRSARS